MELQQLGLAPNQSKTVEKRVIVTDGKDVPLKGVGVYFTRTNNTKALSVSNIAEVSLYFSVPCNKISFQEVVSGMIDTSGDTTLLKAVWQHLSLILIPALKQYQQWGPVSQQQVHQFFCSLESYVDFLKSESIYPLVSHSQSFTARCTKQH